MKKSDIVTHVARRASLSETEAASAVDAVFEAIRDALAKGDKVIVAGFGAFATESRAARTGRLSRRRRVSHRRTEGAGKRIDGSFGRIRRCLEDARKQFVCGMCSLLLLGSASVQAPSRRAGIGQ